MLEQGHNLPVSNLALHPSKPIAASASDDHTWKLWHLTDCLLIMTGEGHSDWISGIDFHPQGNFRRFIQRTLRFLIGRGLATGSGDGTVKLWDFQKQKCVKTLNENQAVWSVKYHESGELLATASLDHVARLWDLITDKCKTVLRQNLRPLIFTAISQFVGDMQTLSMRSSGNHTATISAQHPPTKLYLCGTHVAVSAMQLSMDTKTRAITAPSHLMVQCLPLVMRMA